MTYVSKYDIKPLASKPAAGFISGKKGNRLERQCLRAAFSCGSVAILNDITHCLRHGDLTVPVRGFPHIIEIKSGKHENDRTWRQIERIDKVMRYLVDDVVDDLYQPGHRMTRLAIASPEVSLAPQINKLLADLPPACCGGTRAERGVLFFAARSAEGVPKLLGEFIEQNNLRNGFLLEFLNLRKFEPAAYYPLILSIVSPVDVYDFYAGHLFLWVIVDFGVIADRFDQQGLTAEFNDGDIAVVGKKRTEPGKGQIVLCLSTHLLGRIPYEFTSLDWILDTSFDQMRRGHNITPEPIVAKRAEGSV